ncbi:MAG TPA: CHAP domain-containing protein [Candidatus Saccharimonadales bacterium]|nr:CHAP domain-containing protein [Candidatus Saccharimonadales bacterium]
MSKLTSLQQKIVSLSKTEYAKSPVSYDATVLKYTQGSKEAWCADYISWIYKQADQPFKNPNSGSWRIPGVYTLQEYFQLRHQYQKVGNYQPKTGDVAIYSHGQGHAAIVLSRHGSNITTIGGNESGRLRIDTRPETGKNSYDLIGYGVL